HSSLPAMEGANAHLSPRRDIQARAAGHPADLHLSRRCLAKRIARRWIVLMPNKAHYWTPQSRPAYVSGITSASDHGTLENRGLWLPFVFTLWHRCSSVVQPQSR